MKKLFEFNKQNGDSGTLVLSYNGESNIQEKLLSNTEHQMFEHNKFERIIPIHFKKIDNNIQLQYDINGKSDLKYFIKNNHFYMEDFYKILINLITVVNSSKNNMLNSNRFVIDAEHIYLNKNYFDVNLLYLPINDFNNDKEDQVKTLALEIAPFISDLKGKEFKQILHYLNNPRFSLSGLKELLLDLHKQQDEDEELASETGHEDSKKVKSNGKTKFSTKQGIGINKVQTEKKYRMYAYILMVLAILLVWISYKPVSLFGLLSQPILSLFIVAIGVLYIMGFRFVKKEKQVKDKADSEVSEVKVEKSQENNADQLIAASQKDYNDVVGKTESDEVQDNTVEEQKDGKEKVTENHAYTLKDQTMLLDLSDEDEDLDEKRNVILEASKNYYGSLYDEENSKVIIMNKQDFSAGRHENSDMVITDKKASRNHFKITLIENLPVIVDLASNNGTYLNSEKLTPHKPYELSDNDVVKVIEKEFKFKSK